MRAEVAVCLLAEVAYEHDEDFRGHLPLLFHAMLLLMDSTDSLVFRHAQQVVTHLLYSLSVRHLELHRAAGIAPSPLPPHPSVFMPASNVVFGAPSISRRHLLHTDTLLELYSTLSKLTFLDEYP